MKIGKNTQNSLLNFRGAGRPAIHDVGIRHTSRPFLKRPASLHLTVKIQKNKADIKNKGVLKILKRAILNARKQNLKVIHYSLEYDHVHLLIEANNNRILGKGMQAFGVTMAKAINRVRKLKGSVYKHRYHFHQISSSRQLKNVMMYIFRNGMKHGTAKGLVNPYNSIKAEKKHILFLKHEISMDEELLELLDRGKIFFRGLEFSGKQKSLG
ncbi:MAG: transposase [Bacteriovorax sp.]